jgi:hypothetical protein
MRAYVRAAIVVLSGVALALPTAAPANAASGPWVELDIPAPFADVQGFVHGQMAGHPGNWHELAVNVDGDDDGVTAGLIDWQCPHGLQAVDFTVCTRAAESDAVDDNGMTVTWSPGLRVMRVDGTVNLQSFETGDIVAYPIRVRIHARGPLTRNVSVEHFDFPGDAYDYKHVELIRDQVTFSGRLGWVKVSNSPSNTTWPLRLVRGFYRGYGDGV